MSEQDRPTITNAQVSETPGEQQIMANNIKFPPFWIEDPKLWFIQVESRLRGHNIRNERTMFDRVMERLPQQILTEVRDIVLNPPAADPYTTLKNAILQRTSDSQEQRIRRLLTAEDLGDRKPTQLLRRIQQLLGDCEPEILDSHLVKQLFLQRLPQNVRVVMASSEEKLSVQELATMADAIMGAITPQTIQTVGSEHSQSSDIVSLTKQVNQLSLLMNEVLQQQKSSRDNSRSRSPSKLRSSNSENRSVSKHRTDNNGICWYHQKFGNQAKRCLQPCTFQAQGNSRGNAF